MREEEVLIYHRVGHTDTLKHWQEKTTEHFPYNNEVEEDRSDCTTVASNLIGSPFREENNIWIDKQP